MKFLETAPAMRPFQRKHTSNNVFQFKYLQVSSASIVENQLNAICATSFLMEAMADSSKVSQHAA